ncbi:MAG: DUF2283 domain-containing protein [Spirochaetes bacterium]|nr:DUF2283 domain-containing protein [Spirochaetota bacterium]
MKVYYDKEIDAVYIELNDEKPEAAIEAKEGVNLDMLADGRISGIEILDASKKMDLKTLLTYQIDDEFISLIARQRA